LRFRQARNLAATYVQSKRSGKLVLTGHMNYKHLAFLFVPSKGISSLIEVPNDPREQDSNKRLVDRFHDDDQLTQWQKKAFPAGSSPTGRSRQDDGHLLDGDPVFFLRDENGNLVFFGRAQMFRLPYEHRPIDLVPSELRRATDIDYAEAMFGFVRTRRELDEMGIDVPQGDKQRAYAGRVIVTDAVLLSNAGDIWLAEAFHPRILATPKPTAFQQYLTQQHPDDRRRLDHYDSTPPDSDETVIRGHKFYWHQGLGTDQGLTLEEIRDAIKEPDRVGSEDTQHTRFKPLRPGVQFSFRVSFENLSERELGALCWTLHPRGEQGRLYCHHLGMGKPLGMGAVELHARLHLIDRSLRYGTLFNEGGDNWQLGKSNASENSSESTHSAAGVDENLAIPEVLAHLTQPFEEHLLNELNPDPPCERLADMLRIAMLLKLLEWPGYRPEEDGEPYLANHHRPNTRYMKIQPNEYHSRPVLPDPTPFDEPYFRDRSRPQSTHALAVQSSELIEQFPIGRELRNMVDFAQSEQGVEVRFWDMNPAQVIGFIPKKLIDRPLGSRISVVVTGQHLEPNGRIVVELKLRPRR